MKPRVSLVGAGNVATHLGRGLRDKVEFVQVMSRTRESAVRLASAIGAEAVTEAGDFITEGVDFVIVAATDSAIQPVLTSIAGSCRRSGGVDSVVWLHTAASVGLDVFPPAMPRHGVIYPLQTFSRDLPVDLPGVPFFVEGSSPEVEVSVTELARLISPKVMVLSSERRQLLHGAAVLGCNMVMYLWALADEAVRSAGFDFEVLRPLLQATLDKTRLCPPSEGMTGPARRGDAATIVKHLQSLPAEARFIYKTLSREILAHYHHDTSFLDYEQD